MRKKPRGALSGKNVTGLARAVLRLALAFSCGLLAVSLLLAVYAGPLTAHNVHILRLSADLYRAPQGVLLAASLGALIIDSNLKGR